MAVVDSLLSLIASQGADALILPTGEAPSLEKGGRPTALSMPYPGDEIVAIMIAEVTTEDERARVAAGSSVETRYTAGDGTTYSVQLAPNGGNVRVVFRIPGANDRGPTPAEKPGAVTPARAAGPVRATATATIRVPAAPRAPVPAQSAEPSLGDVFAVVCEPGGLRDAFERAAIEDASDLLFSVGRPPRLRVGGEILELRGPAVEEADLRAFVDPALSARTRADLATAGSADVAVLVEQGGAIVRHRGNLFHQHHGLALALRPIRSDPPTLRGLNLPEELLALARFRSGLVLMTGTTGSGKSTTLVALIEHLNRTSAKHVITLEDPIEYEYVPERALIHQREVGTHVDSFATGLRAALRESPDVILLGEMRDHATIAAALTAAETGHLVLSTLHASGAPMAVDRMIDVFPQHQQAQVRLQLASVLRAIVTQRLVPTVQPPNRAPAIELMLNNTAVATKIREGRGHQLHSEIQTGRAEGMVSLEASLASLVRQRLVRRETAMAHAADATVFQQYLRSTGA